MGRRLGRGICGFGNDRLGVRGCGGVHGEQGGLGNCVGLADLFGFVGCLIFQIQRGNSAICTAY